MDKKLINQLVENSFKENELDSKVVMEIADRLTRPQLRVYIKLLKKFITEHTVVIETAFLVSEQAKRELEETYVNKKVEYVINRDLMIGVKIYENDIIFSKNLKDTLSNLTNYLTN